MGDLGYVFVDLLPNGGLELDLVVSLHEVLLLLLVFSDVGLGLVLTLFQRIDVADGAV